MCLILEIPLDGAPLSQEEAEDVAARNPHGGVAVDLASGEVLYRGLDMAAMTATITGQRGIVAHWRQRTSGPTDLDRVHGWRVGGGYLLHNGVLPSWEAPGHSDTSLLVCALLQSGIDVADHDRHGALLDGIAGSSVIVAVPADGGAPRWYGRMRGVEWWQGRCYSNGYAWDHQVHGKPAPTAMPTHIDPRYTPLQGAWNWGEDDIALFSDVPRRRGRGR